MVINYHIIGYIFLNCSKNSNIPLISLIYGPIEIKSLCEMVRFPVNGSCIYTIDAPRLKAVFNAEMVLSYLLPRFFCKTNIQNFGYGLYLQILALKSFLCLVFLPTFPPLYPFSIYQWQEFLHFIHRALKLTLFLLLVKLFLRLDFYVLELLLFAKIGTVHNWLDNCFSNQRIKALYKYPTFTFFCYTH